MIALLREHDRKGMRRIAPISQIKRLSKTHQDSLKLFKIGNYILQGITTGA